MADFDSAGQHKVKIIGACVTDARFAQNDPNALDVAIHVQSLDGRHEGYWTGELSQRYGVGNASDKMQWEMTLRQLENIGWKHGTNIDDSTLASLVGMETEVGVKASEKNGSVRYFVTYLGPSTYTPKRLDPADVKARRAAIFGANPGQPRQAAPQTNANGLPF
jgi:hypothetical protein